MTPTEAARAMEQAAREICEADPLSPAPDAPIVWNMKPAKAWEPRAAILKAAIDAGLFCHPPKAWIAPNEITIGMFREFAPWVKDASPEVQEVFALWIHGSLPEDWRRMRDAHLKEQAE